MKAKEKFEQELNNASETIKTLKSEKSLLKTIKTKLEGETKKLEKKIKIIENKKVTHVKTADTSTMKMDESKSNASH